MPHPNRSRRKKNAARRLAHSLRPRLSLAEQQERAKANAAAKLRRYPHPPNYADRADVGGPTSVLQPLCYGLIDQL